MGIACRNLPSRVRRLTATTTLSKKKCITANRSGSLAKARFVRVNRNSGLFPAPWVHAPTSCAARATKKLFAVAPTEPDADSHAPSTQYLYGRGSGDTNPRY